MKKQTAISLLLLIAGGLYLAWRVGTTGCGTVYVQEIDGVRYTATGWDGSAGTADVSVSRTVGVWLAAVLTLCILSFVYKDNPFYKVAESVVVGVSAAYWMVVTFWTTLIPNLFGTIFPAWISSWAMPDLSPVPQSVPYTIFMWGVLVLGVMLLWRLAPKGAWIARWPLAFIIGTTAGIRLVGYIQADFVSQIGNTIGPILVVKSDVVPESVGHALANLDYLATAESITLIVGIFCCLVYFFFSVEHKGIAGKVSRVGIWFLMITFGAAFGYTVMGRIALLAIRLQFLFDDWLWLIDPKGLRPTDWTGWF